MKKIRITVFLLVSCLTAWSQTNTFPSSGNVGIGVTNPIYPLQLRYDDGVSNGQHNLANFTRFDSGTGNAGFSLRYESDGTAATRTIMYFPGGIGTTFQVYNGGVYDALHINGNGNVGIGNSNPDANLTIGGGALTTYNLKIKDQVGRAIEIISPTAGSANGRLKITDTNSNLRLGVNSFPDAFHIHGATGKIGIISTNPDADLTIGGKELITYNLKIKDQEGRAIELVSPTVGSAVGRLKITGTNSNLALGVNSFSDAIYLLGSTGYVGIGTTDPQSKLAVNGQIRATEVKVLADISVPDYVFEPDYELRTLKETKEYIEENKHLPEIPSAAEIGENGIDLGDMNMRLLKKIEELTLYVIEQNEQIKKLQTSNARIDELEKKIELLNKD